MSPLEEDRDLQAFQEALLDLLSRRVPPTELIAALRSNPNLVMFSDYIDTMEPRMVEVATALFAKWGRTQEQLNVSGT